MRWIACSGLSFSWYAREQAIQRMADPGRTRFLPQQGVESLPGHLGDRAALERLARGADAMIHLVGIIVEQGPQTFAAVHVEGSRAGLAAAGAAGVVRLVDMSAVGARVEPRATPHPRTKSHADQMGPD